MKISTASLTFDESISINECLSDFAEQLFEEGIINISTLYDKETGRLCRKFSIRIVEE